MKRRKIWLCVLMACLLLLSVPAEVSAMSNIQSSQGTTYTYTISVDNQWIRTQEAYLVNSIMLQDCDLNQPSDVFVFGNLLYVSDTGNRRILVCNLNDGTMTELTNDAFVEPKGMFVNERKLYIADPGAQAVFICEHDGTLLSTITRPENSPLMSSESIFKPTNVVVTEENNLFVVGESSYDGLMQFSEDGEFQGYFAANSRELTLLERIQDLIFTRDQKEQLSMRKPRAIQNIDISSRGLVYSVTQSAEVSYAWSSGEIKTSNALKLHNMAGNNILSTDKFMDDEWNFVDVIAGPYGNAYALTYTGLIYEYDSYGNLIFSFGGRAIGNDRYGLFASAAAMDMDDEGRIYVLDKEKGLVQVFAPTDFANLTHEAISNLENGRYEQSEENWAEILKLNGMSKIAHVGYGRCLLRQQRYEEALEHFKIANDYENYSECFWEIRNIYINRNIGWFALGIVIIVLAVLIKNKLHPKEKEYYNSYQIAPLPAKGVKRFVGDLQYTKAMLRHPIDAIYYLRVGKRGTWLSAGFLLLLGYIVFMADVLGKGFLFNSSLAGLSPILLTLLYVVTVVLFILGNYMMSSLNDGEGTIKNITVFVAYSLVPYLIFGTASILISHALTLNESFVVTLLSDIGIWWSGALLCVSIANTHNYTAKETAKNIILTVLFAIVALVLVALLYLVWDKVIDFVTEVISEVTYRVK